MTDLDGPMPLSSVVFIAVLFLGSAAMCLVALAQLKSAFIDQEAFASYTPLFLILIAVMCLMGILLCEVYLRNVKKTGAPSPKFKRVAKYLLYFSVFALLASPIIIRPALSAYMKSQGYEYCPGRQSALDKTLFQKWAKPSIGCEVWDLPAHERAELLEQ